MIFCNTIRTIKAEPLILLRLTLVMMMERGCGSQSLPRMIRLNFESQVLLFRVSDPCSVNTIRYLLRDQYRQIRSTPIWLSPQYRTRAEGTCTEISYHNNDTKWKILKAIGNISSDLSTI